MKTLLVQADKEFRITVPDDAKITFGPWAPPTQKHSYAAPEKATGTLRIYQGTKDNIIGCFSGVTSFRDVSMEYAEKVAVEEGDTIWKSDNNGYERQSHVKRTEQWTEPEKQLTAAPVKATRKKK